MQASAVPTSDLTTIDLVLDRAAEVNGQVEAYVEPAVGTGPRRSITFGEWRHRADAAARWLSEAGVGRHHVVCLLLGPSIDFAVAFQGIVRLGAVTSGINPRMGRAERESILLRMAPTVTIAEDELVDELGSQAGRVFARSAIPTLVSASRPKAPACEPSDAVAVVWTSGTTGMPKGAIFDHRSLAAVAAGTDVLSQPGDRRLSPLPFSHVSYLTRAWDEIAHGVTTVISPTPWRASTALTSIVTERITVAQGVPTQWALILELDELRTADLSSLRVAGTGAARMAPSQVRQLREALGVPVVVRYTSTETSLGTGTRPGDDDDIVATTVGRPVAGVEISLVDVDGGEVEPGAIGRVRLRSGAVMRGYAASRAGGMPDTPIEIEASLTEGVLNDGWIITGDFGRLDEVGNLSLVGRDNELYQRGGYNVYPAEVEQALDACPEVASVAVVAGADPILGEVGIAFVVPRDPTAVPSLQDLREAISDRLADYKAPDALVVIDALPLTPMGKVDKRALAPAAETAATERSRSIEARRKATSHSSVGIGKDEAPHGDTKEDR